MKIPQRTLSQMHSKPPFHGLGKLRIVMNVVEKMHKKNFFFNVNDKIDTWKGWY